MTPPNQLRQEQPQGQEETPTQAPSIFGGGGESSQRTAQMSAAKQLTTEVAAIHSSLKGLAKAHPEMAESVDKAIQLLVSGMNRTVATMQTRESEGSQPAYA